MGRCRRSQQVRPRTLAKADRVSMPTLGPPAGTEPTPESPKPGLRPKPVEPVPSQVESHQPSSAKSARPSAGPGKSGKLAPPPVLGKSSVPPPAWASRCCPAPLNQRQDHPSPRSRNAQVAGHDLTVFHRSADLCDGLVRRDYPDWWDLSLLSADGAVSQDHAPGISVSISYPGANAAVVADTVAAPIEQQVNGIDGMLYMSSQMGNDGTYTLTVTFDIGTDVNSALVMVQNRVALAMPQLPSQVQNQGITIRKRTPDNLMIVSFYSPDGRYDDIYLSNFATIYVKDELLRVYGVSDINYMGQREYSIRTWLDPQKLAARNMAAMDVAAAIRRENVDAPAGQLGQLPAGRGQYFQLPLDTLGRLTKPEEFENIVVKVGRSSTEEPATGIVRLRDVARVELGAQNCNSRATFDGRPSVGLNIYQLPGTNALDVAESRSCQDGRAEEADSPTGWSIASPTTRHRSFESRFARCSRPSAMPYFSSASWCWSSSRIGGP